MRKVLFICHANPEDNNFTIWLASRLQLMGYTVWCDLKGLIGGEKQWEVIDNIIRSESVKFLLVVSKDIIVKPGQLRDGISKEYHLAESVAKKLRADYIIPLKIDIDSSYDDFIGLNQYNHISFKENWADGLKMLVKKLEKDNVPISNNAGNPLLASWYANEFTTKFGLIKKEEKYSTNIWEIEELWDTFEIHLYENETIAENIRKSNETLPVIRHGDTIATFGGAQVRMSEDSPMGLYVHEPIDSFTISTAEVLQGKYVSDTFPTPLDCENILKRLLTRSFHLMARTKGLYWTRLSSGKVCYYYPKGRQNKVSFYYNNKKKTKNLMGRFKEDFWHYGISVKVITTPVLGYSLKSHILFSEDGYNIWTSKERSHSARRKKGRSWFNEEWRDELFAFLHSLKDKKDEIEITLSNQCTILMPTEPLLLTSPLGYIEPTSKERQAILAEEEKDEQVLDKEEEEHVI